MIGSVGSLLSYPWRLLAWAADRWFELIGLSLGASLYFSYRAITFAYDRGRERRRAGVLWVAEDDSDQPEAPEPTTEPDFVLGYTEHAYTGFYPDFEETQGGGVSARPRRRTRPDRCPGCRGLAHI